MLSNIIGTIVGTKHAEDVANKRRTYEQLTATHEKALRGELPPEALYESGIELAKMGGKYGKPMADKLSNDYEVYKQYRDGQVPPPIRVPQMAPPPGSGGPDASAGPPPNASFGPSAAGIPFPQAPPPPPGADQGGPPPPPSLAAVPPVAGPPRPSFLPFNASEQAVKKVQADTAAANAQAPLDAQQLKLKLSRLVQTIGPEAAAALKPWEITDYIQTGQVKQPPVIKSGPGDINYFAGETFPGAPRLENTAPGAQLTSVPTQIPGIAPPPPPPGMPPIAAGAPPSSVLASPAAQLNPGEAQLLSAAQQVAAKHGLPFDPAKNPRNPYAQIPVRYHGEVSALDAESKMDPTMRASILAMRNSTEGLRQVQESNARNQRADASYRFHVGEMDKLGKPITEAVTRLGRLEDTIAQGTPQADALVAPELLSVMAGGQGSGLRMNEAEIARIVGGRSKWQDLQAAVNKWKFDPKAARSITPEQQKQIHDLTKVVGDKLRAKQALIDSTNTVVSTSENPTEHRQALDKLKKSLTAIDQGTATTAPGLTPPPGSPPTVSTKAQYDALPSGTVYLEDGKKFKKP